MGFYKGLQGSNLGITKILGHKCLQKGVSTNHHMWLWVKIRPRNSMKNGQNRIFDHPGRLVVDPSYIQIPHGPCLISNARRSGGIPGVAGSGDLRASESLGCEGKGDKRSQRNRVQYGKMVKMVNMVYKPIYLL